MTVRTKMAGVHVCIAMSVDKKYVVSGTAQELRIVTLWEC